MNQSFNLKATLLAAENLLNPTTAGRSFLLIPLALAFTCFALSPAAQGQDGDEGNHNTAEGGGALLTYIATANSSTNDTALGFDTLFSNTTGFDNTATGVFALFSNTTGAENTATGFGALASNTTAAANTATGWNALTSNTTGFQNTADGFGALRNNNGDNNTATGWNALLSNNTGNNNTADGLQALASNTTGTQNTATGVNALLFNQTGNNNTAAGYFALQVNTGSNNTACGESALGNNKGGSNNIGLGTNAGGKLTTGNNNIDVGNKGVAGEANTIRIGTAGTQKATFIAGIGGVTVAGGIGVIVGTNGQLGTTTSSERFKEGIKPMDKASEAILALKPVTFRYKHELDPDGIPQFGLVAEEVEKVDPDLVARDADGKVNTVRYEAVNAMLLNEFLKEHRKVEEQEATIAQQQKYFDAKFAQQQKQIEALTAGLQKVNAQIEVSKAAPQIVANNN